MVAREGGHGGLSEGTACKVQMEQEEGFCAWGLGLGKGVSQACLRG